MSAINAQTRRVIVRPGDALEVIVVAEDAVVPEDAEVTSLEDWFRRSHEFSVTADGQLALTGAM